ncbi:uncharacterized protein TRUGW13939_05295 [Talaromyces rugulosus]|uniref:Protein kinase domain-containing protein n=1 Tax=Talaromyces rugulosus TaxID=121627 RepID=A0A7H8QVV3_TALRU|nr:uncharacterized protein TRUGW13939_05295 [Talaromyces rugulosus]QKX58174.1 hypothetical protein TRUGW13939_05295 [Talaromyces rugulosus]
MALGSPAAQPTTSDSSNTDSISDYEIVNFQCGVTTNAELTILCYGKRFHIQISAESLHGNLQLEKEYLKLEIDDRMVPINYNQWQKALIEEMEDQSAEEPEEGSCDNEIMGDAMEDICFWIAMKCNPYMRSLGSNSDLNPSTVEDWFYPETLVLNPKVDGKGNLVVLPSPAGDELVAHLITSLPLPLDMVQAVQPLFIHPSKIFLFHEEDMTGPIQRPEKVFTEPGRILFFKPCYHVLQIPREIQAMVRLQETGLNKTLRVPTLHGLVQYQHEPDQICGLLLTYIEHHESLGFIEVHETPLALREKWILQIQQTIKALHSEGIVWGDAKPDNILVDKNDDLWFIDFGGSFTPGWIDEDKAETFEGDCQALDRMVDHLLGGGVFLQPRVHSFPH